MSEPRDHDTEAAEEEEVDLEALLEQFREPEEAPKKRGGLIWYVFAILASWLAFWLAMQATTGVLDFGPKGPVKMKASKVRDRAAIARSWDGNVAEDYEERCRKGMSSLEIRWVLEDFQGAGLDEGPGSLIDAMEAVLEKVPRWSPLSAEATAKLDGLADQLAARQRAWYRAALGDALRLDEEQVRQLRTNLSKADKEDWDQFTKARSAAAPAGPEAVSRFLPYEILIQPVSWLANDRYAPWTLCELTKEQQGVTRRDEVVTEQLRVIGAEEGEAAPSWFDLRPSSVMITTSDKGETPRVEQELRDAESVFPFTPEQVFPEGSEDQLALAKRLHPAQLKILLLLNPGLAGELSEDLARSGE